MDPARTKWAKGPFRHKETWWDDDCGNIIIEKSKLWKEREIGKYK